ncbi:uncharacterized protein LOC131240024 isoform X2 [Magnolia sinica]|uniref:uncharacterized protein LOC131240024 isoform X2 n=1 Tax=Magnolia sinica TaxID=86752 RepID=UPI002657AB4D|nr:uncharacterized protein LOC131240024 isoform X2 [Magnolia sinica]
MFIESCMQEHIYYNVPTICIKKLNFCGPDYSIPCGWKVLLVFSVVHIDISLHGSVFEFHPWRWELSSAIEERERLRKDAIAWKKQKSGEVEGGKAHDSLVKVIWFCMQSVSGNGTTAQMPIRLSATYPPLKLGAPKCGI